jgi:hypothetical protein
MSQYLIKCQTLTTYEEVVVQDHTFFTSALNVGGQLLVLAALSPEKMPPISTG